METMSNKILVTRSSLPPLEEYLEEIRELWDTRMLTNFGEKHQALQHQLSQYLDVPHVSLFCNGHIALELAIEALQLEGEVITTPFTFISTANAIVRKGLTPVFCDINAEDYTMDVQKIEALITERTCAILPVHVYGNVCAVQEIDRIAKKHNLKVIYDAAHAFGVRVDGVGIGNFGDISMFSFHATKVFHTIEGGGLTYSDKSLEPLLHQLCQYGIQEDGDIDRIGMNAKMPELNAAMGICNLRYMADYINQREELVLHYRELLSECKGIRICKQQQGVTSNYAYFPIVVEPSTYGHNRDELAEMLSKQNIFARKYFHPLISNFSTYRKFFHVNQTPIAEKISSQVLTLPLYSDLGRETVDKICNIVKSGSEK